MQDSSKNNGSFSFAELDPVIREVLDSGGEFMIHPRGVSMLPLIHEGRDTVTIVKPNGRLKKDDIAFYLRDNGHYVLHRVIAVKGRTYTMCGDHQCLPEKGIEDRQIIGVVSSMEINGKTVTPDTKEYKKYINKRRCLLLRRIALHIERKRIKH